jgi:hypothetical protein
VLTVRDEEVTVERYVTPEERARQEAVRRAEEEAAKRSARDNAGERALRQMMGGTLAARGGGVDGEGNPFSLPPPAWLSTLALDPEAVNPKILTEEQARELKVRGGVVRGGGVCRGSLLQQGCSRDSLGGGLRLTRGSAGTFGLPVEGRTGAVAAFGR